MNDGSSNDWVMWTWLAVGVALIVGRVTIRALVRSGRISADSRWARPPSYGSLRRFLVIRIAVVAVGVAATLVVLAIRHAG